VGYCGWLGPDFNFAWPAPPPRLPDEVIAKTAVKYQEALTKLMA